MIIYLCLVLIFVLWLNYEINKTNRLENKNREKFWEKEARANKTRKTDISDLDYITIPVDKLPTDDHSDPAIKSYRDTIVSHSNKKILNLSGFSNTDLKLEYGAANLGLLSEYDNNFIIMVTNLNKWAERLYNIGYPDEAAAVLETAVECRSDTHKTYELLARIYSEQGMKDKIASLIEKIGSVPVRDKESLLKKISKYNT